MLRDQQSWATIFKGRVLSVLKNHPTMCVILIFFILIMREIMSVKRGQIIMGILKLSHVVFQETHLKEVQFGTMLVKISSQREKNKHSGLM